MPLPTNKKSVILFNPQAGRGKAAIFAEQARQHLKHHSWQVEAVLATEYAGHVESVLAAHWGERVELIVLVGGDGTLRELVSGLRTSSAISDIAFIPMGNANVVARELNIPLNPSLAIQLLSAGRAKKLDAGLLKQENKPDTLFLAMLEIGFGAKIVNFVDKLRKGSLKKLYQFWGDLVYAIAGVIALKEKDQRSFVISVDGNEPADTSSHAVIANMRTYAKGWSLTPDAINDDGFLNIAISQRSNLWSIIRTFIAASRQTRLKPTLMKYQPAKRVIVSSKEPLFVQIDGDPIELSCHAEIIIEKAVYSIIVGNI